MGRPSKGHRLRLTTRVPPNTYRAAARHAQASKLSLSEWVAQVVEEKAHASK